MKPHSFQKRRTELRIKVKFNKEQCTEVSKSSCVRREILSTSKHAINVNNVRKETIKIKGCRLLVDAFQLVGIT
jgi:hypothetical protein